MLKIGLQRLDYPEKRNIAFADDPAIDYVVPEAIEPRRSGFEEQLGKSSFFPTYAYFGPSDPSIDCYHFFNTIPVVDIPFVTTFETSAPRWWGVDAATMEIGWKMIAGDNCRGLFAISENARRINEDELSACPPALRQRILAKVETLYPPQPMIATHRLEKSDTKQRKIVFVGADFLRKGGYETVRVVDRLLASGWNFSLELISKLHVQGDRGFAWNRDHERKLREVQAILASRKDSIVHTPQQPNDRVLALLQKSDLLLLPSFGDTFGYVVLEAQAAGCPALTSNVRAFPEINDERRGWVCELPVTEQGKLDVFTEDFQTISRRLESELERCMNAFLISDGSALAAKSEASLAAIRDRHSPADALVTLERLYAARR